MATAAARSAFAAGRSEKGAPLGQVRRVRQHHDPAAYEGADGVGSMVTEVSCTVVAEDVAQDSTEYRSERIASAPPIH